MEKALHEKLRNISVRYGNSYRFSYGGKVFYYCCWL